MKITLGIFILFAIFLYYANGQSRSKTVRFKASKKIATANLNMFFLAGTLDGRKSPTIDRYDCEKIPFAF